MTADPVNLTPFGSTNGWQFEITRLVYESLLAWDRNFNIRPALAESWQIPDERTYIFKLRKGVQFHGGKELDAEDVKYSLELQKTPPPPGAVADYYPKIASVEVVNRYTVRVHMSAPDATMLGYLAWGRFSWIIPKGLYDRFDLRTHADGTGAFQLIEYIPNDHVTLTRFTNYWNRQLPFVDRITMKVLPDEQARVAALRAGAIDGTSLSADSTSILAGDSSLDVLKGLTAAFRELEFTIRGDGKPWNNVKVRQAVNAAINRQEIIDKVYSGEAVYSGKIPAGYGSWSIPQNELKSRWEKYDLAKARQLMKEAGVSGGFPVTLQTIARPVEITQIGEVLKEQLKMININVTVQPLEIGTFAKNNTDGNFDWAVTRRAMRGDPSGFVADFDPNGTTYNVYFKGGYQNPELERLRLEALQITNQAKRLSLYRRIQEIMLTDLALIPLVDPYIYQVVRKRLRGMYVSYDGTERGLIEAWIR